MIHPDEIKSLYCKLGQDWFFDRYEVARLEARKWFIGCVIASVIILSLVISFLFLMPLKTVVPVLIHQNKTTGEVWTSPVKTPYVPDNEQQVQADIVRYLTTYLSYSPTDINQRYELVKLLSSRNVLSQYDAVQANDNPNSPVNVLGASGSATVQVEDIVFLDKENTHDIRHYKHHASTNLAKVDLNLTTIDPSGASKTVAYVATISWEYQGTPKSQIDAWNNWNGFTVTAFRLDPKQIEPASK